MVTAYISDEVVEKSDESHRHRRQKRYFIETFIGMSFLHILCLFAPSTFSWPAFTTSLVLIQITGFCISFSYHRNLAHKSFILPKWLEYFFAYCATLAVQRDPIYWVSIHRYHHQHTDTAEDPHSPTQGFWFSHIGWLFNNEYLSKKLKNRSNVEDLKKQRFYVFLRKTYRFHILGSALVLYAVGGFPFIVWGLGVKTVIVFHLTSLINSACHLWGKQVWNTKDQSRNIWWLSVITHGESWHNNHHAFENSSRLGVEWWQIDSGWYMIWLLQTMGLATSVKVPTEVKKKNKSLSSSYN